MNSILLWLGGLLVAVFTALFAVPYFVDWNNYRGVFEEEATRVLGRKVRVGGEVNLRLLPVPYVSFEKVRIADDTGTLGAPFFSADGFTLWLSVPPLLRGVVEAKQVELVKPVLNLAIDKSGKGNWRSLQISQRALPFVPNDVALQSVKITGGELALRLGPGVEPLSFAGIDGELSASALHGPYRFTGEAEIEGGRHEIRLSTGEIEGDGRVRLKSVVRSIQSGASYVFDGTVANLVEAPEITGTVSATVPIRGVNNEVGGASGKVKTGTAAAPEERGETVKPDAGGDANLEKAAKAGTDKVDGGVTEDPPEKVSKVRNSFDLKGKLALDSHGFRFTELLMSFDNDGRPQLMTGEATGSWRDKPVLDIQLAARWLDIDRIAGGGSSLGPLNIARVLGGRVLDLVLESWDVRTGVTIDQSNLGGDVVGDIDVQLGRRAGKDLRIENFSAALPGGSRVRSQGTLSGRGERQIFRGEVALYGSSFARFMRWATLGNQVPSARSDRAFTVSGTVVAGQGTLKFSDATAEYGGARLKGALLRRWGNDELIELKLEGEDLDIEAVAPRLLANVAGNPETLLPPVAAARTGAKDTDAQAASWLQDYGGDFRVSLDARRVSDGATAVRDVSARLRRAGQALSVSRLRWTTPDGAEVDLSGRVGRKGNVATGELSGWLNAANASAAASLASAVPGDLPLATALRSSLTSAASVSAGFRAKFGSAADGGFEGQVRGAVDGTPLSVKVRMDKGLPDWRSGALQLDLSADAFSLGHLLKASGYETGSGKTEQPAEQSRTRLIVRVSGPKADALGFYAKLDGPEAVAMLSGTGKAYGNGGVSFSGQGDIVSPDGRKIVAALARRWGANIPSFPVAGKLMVALNEDRLTVGPQALKVGTSQASGQIEFARNRDLAISGNLLLTRVSVDRVLGLLASPAADASTDVATRWSDAPFNLGFLDGLKGRIKVAADLSYLDGMPFLESVGGILSFAPTSVSLDDLTGNYYGGAFKGGLSLNRRSAGAMVGLSGRLAGLDLGLLTRQSGQQPLSVASGNADIAMTVQGTGLSVRSVVTGLSGKGSISARGAKISGLTPDAVEIATTGLLTQPNDEGGPTGDLLEKELVVALKGGTLDLGRRTIGFTVRDGALALEPFKVAGEKGVAENTTTVDLSSLKFDSEWRLRSTVKHPRVRAAGIEGDGQISQSSDLLPGISALYVGDLFRALAVAPKITSDVLGRELAVRRMERSVRRLEELRREDDDRARKEAERLKAVEEEKRRALREQGLVAPTPPTGQSAWEPAPAGAPSGPQSGPTGTSGGAAASGASGQPAPLLVAPQPAVRPVPAKPAPGKKKLPGDWPEWNRPSD